jgi:8-oxo-dGTP pyrophosphatase MutT (NUDIX family)
MERDLAAFLAAHRPVNSERVDWWGGRLPLLLTLYLTADRPPDAYVTSVKTVVFSGASVLVLRNPGGMHIYPGGRREPGESSDQALRREVREETGLAIDIVAPLGFVHYQHLNPRPAGYAYPYPDFLNTFHVSRARAPLPSDAARDEYEIEAQFRPLADARALDLPAHQRLLLDAAIAALPYP